MWAQTEGERRLGAYHYPIDAVNAGFLTAWISVSPAERWISPNRGFRGVYIVHPDERI